MQELLAARVFNQETTAASRAIRESISAHLSQWAAFMSPGQKTNKRGLVFRGWPLQGEKIQEAFLAARISEEVVETFVPGLAGIGLIVRELFVAPEDLNAARRIVRLISS